MLVYSSSYIYYLKDSCMELMKCFLMHLSFLCKYIYICALFHGCRFRYMPIPRHLNQWVRIELKNSNYKCFSMINVEWYRCLTSKYKVSSCLELIWGKYRWRACTCDFKSQKRHRLACWMDFSSGAYTFIFMIDRNVQWTRWGMIFKAIMLPLLVAICNVSCMQ